MWRKREEEHTSGGVYETAILFLQLQINAVGSIFMQPSDELPVSELKILIHHCLARRHASTLFSQHGVPFSSVLWLGRNLKRRKEKKRIQAWSI